MYSSFSVGLCIYYVDQVICLAVDLCFEFTAAHWGLILFFSKDVELLKGTTGNVTLTYPILYVYTHILYRT